MLRFLSEPIPGQNNIPPDKLSTLVSAYCRTLRTFSFLWLFKIIRVPEIFFMY